MEARTRSRIFVTDLTFLTPGTIGGRVEKGIVGADWVATWQHRQPPLKTSAVRVSWPTLLQNMCYCYSELEKSSLV